MVQLKIGRSKQGVERHSLEQPSVPPVWSLKAEAVGLNGLLKFATYKGERSHQRGYELAEGRFINILHTLQFLGDIPEGILLGVTEEKLHVELLNIDEWLDLLVAACFSDGFSQRRKGQRKTD